MKKQILALIIIGLFASASAIADDANARKTGQGGAPCTSLSDKQKGGEDTTGSGETGKPAAAAHSAAEGLGSKPAAAPKK